MTIKTPSKLRVAVKAIRTGDILEGHASTAKCRIRPPETLRAAKIGQTGIHPHSRTHGNQKSLRLTNEICGTVQGGIQQSRFMSWRKICCHWIASPFRCDDHGDLRVLHPSLPP